MKQSTTHEFAFFIPRLSANTINNTYVLQDKDMIARITNVVRLTIDETCVLFDHCIHVRVTLEAITKKSLTFHVVECITNKSLKPTVTCLLPLLKKDDLGDAISTITACGVTNIQLVSTIKVQRAWGGTTELERLERVMIAAAEQAKYYTLPILHEPIPLLTALQKHTNALCIFFDPAGKPLTHIITTIQSQKPAAICLLVGPEGDLTNEEKKSLHDLSITFCALTPTVLRAHLALTLATGIIRSL